MCFGPVPIFEIGNRGSVKHQAVLVPNFPRYDIEMENVTVLGIQMVFVIHNPSRPYLVLVPRASQVGLGVQRPFLGLVSLAVCGLALLWGLHHQ